MILYNVTIKVDNQIAEDWTSWMLNEHIPDLLNTGMFIDTKLCRLLEQDETEGITYAAQYYCADIDKYNTYISKFAMQMREKAFAKFGTKFVAYRTVMEIIS